jgi:hypothetical protein
MQEQSEDDPVKTLATKQRDKLDLEIKNLEKKNKWEFVTQFIPVIATLMGVAGFFFTVFVFQAQQRAEQTKDRISREVEQTTRLQTQIRADCDEILRSTGKQGQRGSRIVFLLEEMKTLLGFKLDDKKMADTLSGYEQSLTESLVVLIRDDCDFTKPQDVQLADTIVAYWSDYTRYLREEPGQPDKLNYILFKYTSALRRLSDKNPGYLQNVTPTADGDAVEVAARFDKRPGAEALYGLLLDIVEGFKLHLEILDKAVAIDAAKKIKQMQLEEFKSALNNPELAEYLLGKDSVALAPKSH